MPAAKKSMTHKHLRLDQSKIRRAQKVLRARTETETIERALDSVIAEHERDRMALDAHEQFLKSGARIADVYGRANASAKPEK